MDKNILLKILKDKYEKNELISFLYHKNGVEKKVDRAKIIKIKSNESITVQFNSNADTTYNYIINNIITVYNIECANSERIKQGVKKFETGSRNVNVAKYYQNVIQVLSEKKLIDGGIEKNYQKISEKLTNRQMLSPLLKQYLDNEKVKQNMNFKSKDLILPFISNTSQKKAIQIALNNDVSIIQGPPGTGKTQTILNLIASSLQQNYRVLVVSKNNSAIDNVAEKLAKHQTLHQAYLRVGNTQTNVDMLNELEVKLDHDYRQKMSVDENTPAVDLAKLDAEITVLEEQFETLTKKKNFLNELKTQQRHIDKKLKLYQLPFKDDDTRTIFKKFTNPEVILYISNLWKSKQTHVNMIQRKLAERILFKHFNKEEQTRYIWRLERLYAKKEIEKIEAELQEYTTIQKKIQTLYDTYQRESIYRTNKKVENFFHQKEKEMLEYKHQLTTAFEEMESESCNIDKSKNYSALRSNATKLYPIVLSTADSCVNLPITTNDKFDVVIMDEASQADLITFLPVMNILKKQNYHLVIVGDDRQLKNVVTENFVSAEQEVHNKVPVPEIFRYTTQTVLSSVKAVLQPAETLLREHYRCDYNIINYCNKKYYEDQLIIYSSESKDTSMKIMKLNKERNSERGIDNKSMQNMMEVRAIEKHIQTQTNQADVSVISPYKAQKFKLQEVLPDIGKNVGTIHQFQGRENKTVLFSTVLTNEVGMLQQDKTLLNDALINVAVSRAQDEFILFTHDLFFKENKHHLYDLIRYTETYGEELESSVNSIFAHLYKQYKYVHLFGKHDSLWEKVVFDCVNQKIEDSKHSGFYVAAKVPVADICGDERFLQQNPILRQFALHPQAHLDICIIHGLTNQVIAVIEVDGKYHNKVEQIERDKKKDQILEHHQIPIWRLRSKDVVENHDIENWVGKILEENQWRQKISDKMENGDEGENEI